MLVFLEHWLSLHLITFHLIFAATCISYGWSAAVAVGVAVAMKGKREGKQGMLFHCKSRGISYNKDVYLALATASPVSQDTHLAGEIVPTMPRRGLFLSSQ